MPLARIISHSRPYSQALALLLLDRGYTVEVTPPEKISDHAADMELSIESGQREFSGSVRIQNDDGSNSLDFVCRFDSGEIEVRRADGELSESAAAVLPELTGNATESSGGQSAELPQPNSVSADTPLSPELDEDILDFLERTLVPAAARQEGPPAEFKPEEFLPGVDLAQDRQMHVDQPSGYAGLAPEIAEPLLAQAPAASVDQATPVFSDGCSSPFSAASLEPVPVQPPPKELVAGSQIAPSVATLAAPHPPTVALPAVTEPARQPELAIVAPVAVVPVVPQVVPDPVHRPQQIRQQAWGVRKPKARRGFLSGVLFRRSAGIVAGAVLVAIALLMSMSGPEALSSGDQAETVNTDSGKSPKAADVLSLPAVAAPAVVNPMAPRSWREPGASPVTQMPNGASTDSSNSADESRSVQNRSVAEPGAPSSKRRADVIAPNTITYFVGNDSKPVPTTAGSRKQRPGKIEGDVELADQVTRLKGKQSGQAAVK